MTHTPSKPSWFHGSPVQRGANTALDQAWAREVGRAHAERVRLAEILRGKREAGKRVQRQFVRQYLDASAAQLCGALAALRGEPARHTAEALAATVNPRREGYGSILWHKHPKKNGEGYRPICALPRDLKAVHYVIAGALKALFVPKDHIFGVSRRGRDDAARRLKEAQNSGLNYLAKLDIVDCFQSINPDSLYQLPLPKEVIRRALDTRNMTFREWEPQIATTSHRRLSGIPVHPHSESGPRGLLQGSPVSNLILAWLLNDMPMPEGAVVLVCADNIAVAAADPDTRQAAIDTLVAYFQRDCSAGPLNLCPPVCAGPGTEPLDFLSYEFDSENTYVGVSERALMNLEKRLAQLEADFEANLPNEKQSDLTFALGLWQALRSFRYGFCAVDDIEDQLVRYANSAGIMLARSQSDVLCHLHAHVFDPSDTVEGAMIARLIQRFRLPKYRNNNCVNAAREAE